MENRTTSWFWIIFWLLFFWPIGLLLLFKKFATDRSAIMSEKTGMISFVGCALLFVGGVVLFASSSSATLPSGSGAGAVVLIIGGAFLLQKASKIKQTAAKYKKYIDIVINKNIRRIDDISRAVGLPYNAASDDLQYMINIGYLRDAYIDHNSREIAWKRHDGGGAQNRGSQAQTRAVRCPGCGAKNVATVGAVSECEYCGTPI